MSRTFRRALTKPRGLLGGRTKQAVNVSSNPQTPAPEQRQFVQVGDNKSQPLLNTYIVNCGDPYKKMDFLHLQTDQNSRADEALVEHVKRKVYQQYVMCIYHLTMKLNQRFEYLIEYSRCTPATYNENFLPIFCLKCSSDRSLCCNKQYVNTVTVPRTRLGTQELIQSPLQTSLVSSWVGAMICTKVIRPIPEQ